MYLLPILRQQNYYRIGKMSGGKMLVAPKALKTEDHPKFFVVERKVPTIIV